MTGIRNSDAATIASALAKTWDNTKYKDVTEDIKQAVGNDCAINKKEYDQIKTKALKGFSGEELKKEEKSFDETFESVLHVKPENLQKNDSEPVRFSFHMRGDNIITKQEKVNKPEKKSDEIDSKSKLIASRLDRMSPDEINKIITSLKSSMKGDLGMKMAIIILSMENQENMKSSINALDQNIREKTEAAMPKVLTDMKPELAVKILAKLEPEVNARLLGAMKPEDAAKILDKMSPDKLAKFGEAFSQIPNGDEGNQASALAVLIDIMPPKKAAIIMENIPADKLSEVLQTFEEADVETMAPRMANIVLQMKNQDSMKVTLENMPEDLKKKTESAIPAVITAMDPDNAAKVMGNLTPRTNAIIMSEMAPDEAAKVFAKIPPDRVENIIESFANIETEDKGKLNISLARIIDKMDLKDAAKILDRANESDLPVVLEGLAEIYSEESGEKLAMMALMMDNQGTMKEAFSNIDSSIIAKAEAAIPNIIADIKPEQSARLLERLNPDKLAEVMNTLSKILSEDSGMKIAKMLLSMKSTDKINDGFSALDDQNRKKVEASMQKAIAAMKPEDAAKTLEKLPPDLSASIRSKLPTEN